MTPQCSLLTLAAPLLTTNTTLPSSLHVTTEPQRSYWVRDVGLDWRATRSCQSCLVGVEALVPLTSPAELGWSHPCDVWSIGCILFEYYQGFTMYQVTCLYSGTMTAF